MENPLLQGKLSISRPSRGGRADDNVISIRIKDKNSGIDFCEIEVGAEDMMKALTGLTEVPMYFSKRGVAFIGKHRQRKAFSHTVNDELLKEAGVKNYDSTALKEWARSNVVPPVSWYLDSYLGSQGSVTHDYKNGTTTLNMAIYKYTEEEDGS